MIEGNKDDFVKILRALAKPGDPVVLRVIREQVLKRKGEQKFLENSKNLLEAWISGSEERFKEFMGRLSQQEIMFLRELLESFGAELYNELSVENREELERRLVGGSKDEQIREVSNRGEAEPAVEEGREA